MEIEIMILTMITMKITTMMIIINLIIMGKTAKLFKHLNGCMQDLKLLGCSLKISVIIIEAHI